ncbi:hypothetical protein K437DRAFT_66620 [Tilletiaria anomala UBC 951]|uniref:Uncharacterized protein n=1 Tax=Tilletiaria anomala (strain ATCC 24038 / CBS 436.72 / UBC 951) TaxID=1037660 RepID=A0A066WD08_TILAU|nr:uncharacterized protein K437DRAFT_66620 [Tilletiaria anomala UBC 951]KDN50403.1 hypothetical protein K437DRAFT_66620 [Tilletiaria anomala UBC 951]
MMTRQHAHVAPRIRAGSSLGGDCARTQACDGLPSDVLTTCALPILHMLLSFWLAMIHPFRAMISLHIVFYHHDTLDRCWSEYSPGAEEDDLPHSPNLPTNTTWHNVTSLLQCKYTLGVHPRGL